MASKGLCKIKNPLATRELIKISEDEGIRYSAVIDALGESRNPAALPTLRTYLAQQQTNPRSWETQIRVIEAIAKIEHPDVLNILFDVLKSNSSNYDNPGEKRIFDTTLERLTKIGGTAVIDLLSQSIVEKPLSRYRQIILPKIQEMKRGISTN